MRPPISYFGGKSRLAPWIASLLPPHRVYVEPFCGSAAVLFAKPPSTHEIINDLDGELVHFMRVLRERPDELELACRLTPYARDEYAAAKRPAGDVDELERARRWWVLCSQSFAKLGAGWSTSVVRQASPALSVRNRIGYFAAAAERLSGVVVENRDAMEVIEAYDAPDTALYVDPPYLQTTRTGLRTRASGDYLHEFAADDDHRALAQTLARTSGAVFVSGYPSALYDELYVGWSRIEREVVCRVGNMAAASNPHRTEVLWSNRPLDEGRLSFDIQEPARA